MHRIILPVAACALALATVPALADKDHDRFSAKFSGFEEVGGLGAGQTGAILSGGTATLELELDRQGQTLTYTLTFSGTNAPITQSHIHFGKRHVGGGVIVFLCSNLGTGPAGTPMCFVTGDGTSGMVTGTINLASVIGPTPQGITPGNFDGLVAALDNNTAYGNIHTTSFPAGEIRGQIRRNRGHDHDD